MEQHPTPSPEREPQIGRNLFNIEAMTNEEIIETGRILAAAADELEDSHTAVKLDDLWERGLQHAIRRLPAIDLDRARRLLSEQMTSGNPHDLEAAAEWVEGFLEYDYELVRDTLIRIDTDESLPGWDTASELTALRIGDVKNRLTPEQRADFEARLAAQTDY